MASATTSLSASGGKPRQPPEMLIERLFKRISEVSSLPIVSMRIIEVANNSMTGAEDLLEAVQLDAALATRIKTKWPI